MRRVILLALTQFIAIICISQSKSIVGAWIWQDSTTSISIFIKEDGTIGMHRGPIHSVMLSKNIIHGNYRYNSNQDLLIQWPKRKYDYIIKVLFVDQFKMQIKFPPTTKNKYPKPYTFHRVVDEEVDIK